MDVATLTSHFSESYLQLANYAELLTTTGVEWGLLGPREGERIWERHILNSLALEPLLPENIRVCDVGSGAGLPGIPLAIVRPDLQITLLDSLKRRAEFLTQTVAELELPNVTVQRDRAEDLAKRSPESYDVVVCRAVAPLEKLIRWCLPLLASGGNLIALKGESAAEEVGHARVEFNMSMELELLELTVPLQQDPTWAIVVSRGKGARPFLGFPQLDYIA